jgi:N-methylhydantoinase A
MGFRIGIDIGGTFTDAVSVDDKGNLVMAKVTTSHQELKLGVVNVLHTLAERNGLTRKRFLKQVTAIVHGTTQGTDTIIARSGPELGIIATRGHTDTIQLRRVGKGNLWDWRMPFPQPLVPRYLRVGVEERVNGKGEILRPLNEDTVHKAVAYLRKMGVKHIVVTCIFSFLNPEHEKRIREIIKEDYPEAHVTLSHEVLPAIGEYERFNTAVIDAYIRPVIADYIQSLENFLVKEGFKGQLLFIQNNGGLETAKIAVQKPASLVISGPAAGPAAAMVVGGLHGYEKLLSVDMGGTSFDIAIIDNGRIAVKAQSVVGQLRFSLPVVDVDTLGAGGGSVAWFDVGANLHIGPKSAGAEPGPACYGNGGEEATVTDANIVLGYISPDDFLDGKMKLRKALAKKVIREKVADRLGLSVPDAALVIYKVYNSIMADGVAHDFIKGGFDPRDFVLCAGGAAAPLSALDIARDLGITQVLIPKCAPTYSAFGMLGVDIRHDFTRFYRTVGNELDFNKLKRLYREMESEANSRLNEEGVPENRRTLLRTMRLKYYGQFRTIEVSWPVGPANKKAIAEGISNFHRRHKELYGFFDQDLPIEFMSFGLTAVGKMPGVTIKKIKRGTRNPSSALKGERNAYFEEGKGFVKTKIYEGDRLLAGNVLEGPCIIEERLMNIVIPPTFKMRVDAYGNYVTG